MDGRSYSSRLAATTIGYASNSEVKHNVHNVFSTECLQFYNHPATRYCCCEMIMLASQKSERTTMFQWSTVIAGLGKEKYLWQKRRDGGILGRRWKEPLVGPRGRESSWESSRRFARQVDSPAMLQARRAKALYRGYAKQLLYANPQR
jgi:hypothetical protein